jgi:GNAT superfamily N-acetyltransferase
MMQQYQIFEGKPPSPYHGAQAMSQFQVTCLSEADIPEFLNNQERAWLALAPDKKHHLKLRTSEDVMEHISAPMPMIGVRDAFNNNKLVAQGLVSYMRFSDVVRNLDGYPISDTELATTAIIQSLSTDEKYAGKGMAQMVLEAAKGMAAMAGMTQIIGKVADDNIGSQKSFLKNGFTVAATGVDPVKNYPVFYYSTNLHHRSAMSVDLALAS